MLRVLTLSTLFPDANRPNFGVFVERQTRALAARPDVLVKVVAPLGLPPFPLDRLPHYHRLDLPEREVRGGLSIERPRFLNLPATGGRFHARLLARRLLPLLRDIRREFAFDILDAQFFFPDGPAAIQLGRALGVPVSIKARGADIHHWGSAPGTAAQVRAAATQAQGLLAVSEAMRADMTALGIPAEKIRVHRTGVDLDRFRPRDRATAKAALGVRAPLVVSLGALIPRKGHDVVLEAVAALPGVHLWIVGEGPERPRLAAQIARMGLSGRVRLTGALAHDALPELLAAADVMALASSSEGLANAWVEALASGTPIVITDAGGAREVVTEASGRIVARNAPAFAAAIETLLEHPPEPGKVREAAQSFTWEANAAALHAHLAGLVADYRAASSSG